MNKQDKKDNRIGEFIEKILSPYGGEYTIYVKLEEISILGEYSKVKLLEMRGNEGLPFELPEFVLTNSVIWKDK